MDYKAVGSVINVTVIKDDGNLKDRLFAFPIATTRTRKSREVGVGPGYAQEQVAIEITPATPATCTSFELSSLRVDFDLEGV